VLFVADRKLSSVKTPISASTMPIISSFLSRESPSRSACDACAFVPRAVFLAGVLLLTLVFRLAVLLVVFLLLLFGVVFFVLLELKDAFFVFFAINNGGVRCLFVLSQKTQHK